MRLTVVIPVRADAVGLRACLDALSRARSVEAAEIIVALNDPSPAVRSVVDTHGLRPRTVLVTSPGAYGARNAAVTAAGGEVMAFLDADTVPDPEWIERGLEASATHPVVAGAVVQQLSAQPGIWEQYDAVMHLRQEAHAAAGFGATANLWVRRDAWDLVGPFDASLRSGGDLDWGRRATSLGLAPVFAPGARVTHRTRRTAKEVAAVQFRIAGGWAQLTHDWRPWREEAMTTPLRWVNTRAGLPVHDRTLALPHAVAMGARWCGWVGATAQSSIERLRSPSHE